MANLALHKYLAPGFTAPDQMPIGPVEIDWVNPLARGLVFAVFLENGNTQPILGGIKNAALDLGGAGIHGWDQTVGATTSTLQYPIPKGLDYSCGTIAMSFERVEAPQEFAKLFITVGSEFQLYRVSSDSTVELQIGGTTGSATFTDPVFEVGVEKAITVTWDDVANFRQYIVNGAKGTHGGSFTGGAESNATYHLGNRENGERYAGGIIRYNLIWDRVLTDPEMADISANPYQVLKPVTDPYYFTAAAAAAAGDLLLTNRSIANYGGVRQ